MIQEFASQASIEAKLGMPLTPFMQVREACGLLDDQEGRAFLTADLLHIELVRNDSTNEARRLGERRRVVALARRQIPQQLYSQFLFSMHFSTQSCGGPRLAEQCYGPGEQ